MPRVPYVGVNDKAKKVKKMYIGVDGKARKILKAYVGVNGIARIFYTADWWVPYGLKESNCIAAYQFYHVKNQSTANTDITGHMHTITDSRYCSWDSSTGYYITSGSDASGLKTSLSVGEVTTAVFWYSGLPAASDTTYDGGRWFRAKGNPADMMAARIGKISYYYNGEWKTEEGLMNYPGFYFSYNTNGYLRGYRGNSHLPSSGVVAFDRTYPQIYVNGTAIGVTYFNITLESINNMPFNSYLADIGGGTRPDTYIRAAAFFNCKLTSRQHSDLAKALSEVK